MSSSRLRSRTSSSHFLCSNAPSLAGAGGSVGVFTIEGSPSVCVDSAILGHRQARHYGCDAGAAGTGTGAGEAGAGIALISKSGYCLLSRSSMRGSGCGGGTGVEMGFTLPGGVGVPPPGLAPVVPAAPFGVESVVAAGMQRLDTNVAVMTLPRTPVIELSSAAFPLIVAPPTPPPALKPTLPSEVPVAEILKETDSVQG